MTASLPSRAALLYTPLQSWSWELTFSLDVSSFWVLPIGGAKGSGRQEKEEVILVLPEISSFMVSHLWSSCTQMLNFPWASSPDPGILSEELEVGGVAVVQLLSLTAAWKVLQIHSYS